MKRLRILIWIIIPVVIEKGFAQTDTISWENGNKYSLLSELGKVWIDQYKGPTIKAVKIQFIDTLKGKVTYINEGTLHDVYFSNIRMITPGKYFNQCITFSNKTPIIKEYPESPGYSAGTFKSHVKFYRKEPIVKKAETITETQIPKVEKTVTEEPSTKTNQEADGRVIFGNGKFIDVKINSLNNEQVTYKRIDLMNGPLYILTLTIPGTLRAAKVKKQDGFTTIDFSK